MNKIEVNNTRHANMAGVTLTKGYRRKLLVNHIIEYILYFIILAVIVFIGFLTVKGPILTNTGYIYPIRDPAKNNAQVVVTRVEDNFAGRLYNGIKKQNPIYGKVVVGNYGTLTSPGDTYTVVQDGKVYNTSVKVQTKHGNYLNNEYVIKITKGKNKGKEIIVDGTKVRTLKQAKSNN